MKLAMIGAGLMLWLLLVAGITIAIARARDE